MLARWFRDATLGVLACSTVALAQDAPPQTPPAAPPQTPPPAAPPATPQGAPRHRSAAKIGDANVVVEHGQPAWTDDRIAQIAQIPVGGVWRMGSEGITTLSVAGAPVFFGEALIAPGRYGFNLLHATDSSWNFVVFDPIHETQVPQMVGDETHHQIPSVFVGDAPESAPALAIDLSSEGDSGACELKWGPMRVRAPFTAVTLAESELELEGRPALATWYRRPLRADADLTVPAILGAIDLEIDDESCAMNVYVLQEGPNLVALFRNQERERWERENAGMEEQTRRFDAMIQQFGQQAEATIGPILQQLRRRKAKNEVMLEDTVARPDNLKFSAPAEDATPGRLHCDVLKTRSGHSLEVIYGCKKAVIRIDDSAFTLKPSG